MEGALEAFEMDVCGLTALDIGASTGGFTDCLLQRGVLHVTAVDAGEGQLAHKLQTDPRVTSIEHLNARGITLEDAKVLQMISFISPVLENIPDETGRTAVAAEFESHIRNIIRNI